MTAPAASVSRAGHITHKPVIISGAGGRECTSLLWGSATVFWWSSGRLAAFFRQWAGAGFRGRYGAVRGGGGGGAALTVVLAAWRGLPIATTHALIGGMIGAGWLASGDHLEWSTLGVTAARLAPAAPVEEH